MKPNSKLPYLIQAIASVIFGFSFLMTSTLLDHLDIFQLLGVRFLIAAGLMSVLALTRVIKLNIRMRDMKWLLVLTVF